MLYRWSNTPVGCPLISFPGTLQSIRRPLSPYGQGFLIASASLLPDGRCASSVLGRGVRAPGLCSSGMFLCPLQSGSPSQWRQPLLYIPSTREQPQSISGVMLAPSSCGISLREQQCADCTHNPVQPSCLPQPPESLLHLKPLQRH